jgi:sugar/nucleoside kinase (ribokinase family)
MAANLSNPRDLMIGELHREFYFAGDGLQQEDIPGGNALYAAVGYMLWEEGYHPGLLTRVGNNYPSTWIEEFQARGIHTAGVHLLEEDLEQRVCFGYKTDRYQPISDLPVYCGKNDFPIPSELLDYHPEEIWIPNRRQRKPTSIREEDIPSAYIGATGAHICPGDYLSHNLIPAILRSQGFTTITLDPGPEYMDQEFLGDIPALITGLSAFLPSEDEVLKLYKGQIANLLEIARELSRYGCPLIVIKRGENGQLLYDGNREQGWEIPAYPSRVANRAGAGDAFCGGFLAGLRNSYDPLEAAICGSAAASLVVEGCGPFFALDAVPGLLKARQHVIREQTRLI